MEQRTEDNIVTQAGIEVILGGETYTIRPLVIKESREWRKEVIDLISELPKFAEVTTDTPDEFGQALKAMLVSAPEKVAGLFFKYAKELDPERIEAEATDAELAVAFEQVIEIAFPLAQSMTKVMKHLAQRP